MNFFLFLNQMHLLDLGMTWVLLFSLPNDLFPQKHHCIPAPSSSPPPPRPPPTPQPIFFDYFLILFQDFEDSI